MKTVHPFPAENGSGHAAPATGPGAAKSGPGIPDVDFEPLLRRIETLAIFDPDPDQARKYLERRDIWDRLSRPQALRWIKIVRAAGMADLFEEMKKRLQERFSNDAAVQGQIGEIECVPEREEEKPKSGADKGDLGEPFDAMRKKEDGLSRYMALFQGREDCFARQWADRKTGGQGYVPVRRPMDRQDVLDHLRRAKTYGIYILQGDSRVRLGVIDADIRMSLRKKTLSAKDKNRLLREKDYLLTRLPEIAEDMNMPCLTEVSGGKGFHFWFFFDEPVPAAEAKGALARIAKAVAPDLACFGLEVFPKQDRLSGKGLGNLVKLPLGIHRVTGKPSWFVHVRDKSPEAQLAGLSAARTIRMEDADFGQEKKAPVVAMPKYKAWAESYPELARLMERCHPLGTLIAACHRNRALSVREEKIILSTVGFLPRGKTLVHHLMQSLPEYNPHLVDYKLSRLRGTPLGCRRIHGLMNLAEDYCRFPDSLGYPHPLRHMPDWVDQRAPSEKIVNLDDALQNLEHAMAVVRRFLPAPDA